MSQVEFVTVMTRLFSKCRVEPAAREGLDAKGMRDWMKGLMEDSDTRLTLQMNRPEELRLRYIRR
jgi:hypothetical protein